MNQIFATGVSPIHVIPIFGIGMSLVIHVVIAFVINKTVWIVVPMGELRIVILVAVGFGIVGIIAFSKGYVIKGDVCVENVESDLPTFIGQTLF